MKLLRNLFVVLALAAFAGQVYADDGSIKITSPADGAVLSGSGNKLDFDVHLGPNGNHVHIYVDDQNPIVFRDVGSCPCSIDLPTLAAGTHTVTVKEATVSHALTGVMGKVTFSVK